MKGNETMKCTGYCMMVACLPRPTWRPCQRQARLNFNLSPPIVSVPRSMHRAVSCLLGPLIIQSGMRSPSPSKKLEPRIPCHSVVANSPLTYCLERPSSSFLPYTQQVCAYMPLCTYAYPSHWSTSQASTHTDSSDTSFTLEVTLHKDISQ